MIAKIAVRAARFSIDKPYSYRFGPDMTLVPGVRVMVPFGSGNRRTEGVVLSIESGDETKLKVVLQQLDTEPLLPPTMLRLAAFLRERYFCTFLDAVRAMLPAPLWFRTIERFALAGGEPWAEGLQDKLLTVWITTNCGKFLEMGIPDHLTCFLRNQVCRSGSNSWNWIRINRLVPNQ